MSLKTNPTLPILAVTCAFLLAAMPAAAQTVANGPYYAVPAWDQTLPAGQRFIVLSNLSSKAVLDRETGLVWEKTPDTASRTWSQARLYCAGKPVGGKMGWRLPAVNEMSSLYNVGGVGYEGGLPGAPFVLSTTAYWTSTLYVDDSGSPGPYPSAYIVSFTIGGNDGPFPQNNLSTFGSWCVRGGRSGSAE